MWLKLKIFFGYVILVLLSFFIIYQFRQEQMLRHTLRKKEKELVTMHRLTEKSYIGLWSSLPMRRLPSHGMMTT